MLTNNPWLMTTRYLVAFHDDVIKWKHFPRYWPFVRGIHRWIPLTKASDEKLWCFRWSPPEQTVEQTIETPVIWDTIAFIVTSLYCSQEMVTTQLEKFWKYQFNMQPPFPGANEIIWVYNTLSQDIRAPLKTRYSQCPDLNLWMLPLQVLSGRIKKLYLKSHG